MRIHFTYMTNAGPTTRIGRVVAFGTTKNDGRLYIRLVEDQVSSGYDWSVDSTDQVVKTFSLAKMRNVVTLPEVPRVDLEKTKPVQVRSVTDLADGIDDIRDEMADLNARIVDLTVATARAVERAATSPVEENRLLAWLKWTEGSLGKLRLGDDSYPIFDKLHSFLGGDRLNNPPAVKK